MKDRSPPIIPQEYLSGVKVVDIGDVRVARGLTRRSVSSCPHQYMLYDTNERRIWCASCETEVDAFYAFKNLVEHFDAAEKDIDRRKTALGEAEAFQVRSLAAKAIDDVWRRRKRVPACPHCKQGLFPEDFARGVKTTLGREYAEAQRARSRKDAPT
nr:hypothetical protein [Mesorhizobium sp.]